MYYGGFEIKLDLDGRPYYIDMTTSPFTNVLCSSIEDAKREIDWRSRNSHPWLHDLRAMAKLMNGILQPPHYPDTACEECVYARSLWDTAKQFIGSGQ